MTFLGSSGLINTLACLALGLFVYFKRRGDIRNRTYCVFDLSIALYSFGYFMWQSSAMYSTALLWFKILFVGIVLINATFLNFIFALLGTLKQRKSVLSVSYFLSFVFICLNFSNLLYAELVPRHNMGLWPVPTWIFSVYLTFWFSQTLYGLFELHRAFTCLTGLKRTQIQYVFWSTALGYFGGSTNWPMWYGIPLPPYLNTLISVYAAILAYAVVRHQLMDIEVIVKRTIVFAGIVASAVTLISLPLALAQVFIGRALGIPPFWLLSMGIATAVLIYRPIDRILTQITDRYLFQKKINYRILLKEATEYLAHLDSLKRQARRMVAFLLLKARIQNASIYAFQNYAPGSLLLEAARPPIKVSGHKTILFSHPLARYMKEHRGPIELQTIQESRRQERDPSKIEDLDQILKLLNEHKAEAAIPCFGSSASERARRTELHLRGILFLGPQKSDEPYRDEDLDVFFTLGQESSIAFENARLYDEAVHKKRELEEINEKMTQAQNDLIRALHDAETAKKEAEESREEALEAKKRTEEMEVELIRREKLVFVERLVQGLSHEIFNPMASILMEVNRVESIFKRFRKYYHETLSFVSEERKTSIESDFDLYRQSIYLLKRTTDHIMRVVDTLNEMQKPDDQTIKPIDFKGYLATALPVIEAQSHGDVLEEVRIDFEIQHNLPLVNANVAQLTQVFLNLYRNALYAVKDRENKEIKLEAIEDPERQEFLRITFMDNGTGIAPEILPKIFDYMFSTKGDKGHGIGLNMCKVIIERFGGTLSCESELWKGAKFIVRLPFVREATRDQTMEENSAQ